MSLESKVREAITDLPPKEPPRQDPPQQPTNIDQISTDKSLIKTMDDKDKSEWIALRTDYANKIYWLLCLEITFICLIIAADGFSLWGFKTNEWLLGSVFYGVLTHTFLLVRTIVKNLFTR